MNELTPVMKNFILRWGEMGNTWGLNRTVAQIYALLFLSSQALTAEEISEHLSLARSTVSTGLHELQGWGVVRIVHLLGDRRDHFETMGDVWEMFRVILRERKSREIDPLLSVLKETITEVDERDSHTKGKLQAMLDLFEAATVIFNQVDQLPTDILVKLARMGNNFSKMLNMMARE
jgi:DNA-binding transcriptional regulator GbsR (MarR family)